MDAEKIVFEWTRLVVSVNAQLQYMTMIFESAQSLVTLIVPYSHFIC